MTGLSVEGSPASRRAKTPWPPLRGVPCRQGFNQVTRELIALREDFGPDLVVCLDLHHRMSLAETADFCNRLPAGTLVFKEEPIRCETPEACRPLRFMTNIPFALGEEFASAWHAAPCIEKGMTQYMRLDTCTIGGSTEAMKVTGWCERHDIDLMPGNPLGPVCTVATIHMAAAVPNFSRAETRQGPTEDPGFHNPEWFPVQIQLDGITYKVPERQGMGENGGALRRAILSGGDQHNLVRSIDLLHFAAVLQQLLQ